MRRSVVGEWEGSKVFLGLTLLGVRTGLLLTYIEPRDVPIAPHRVLGNPCSPESGRKVGLRGVFPDPTMQGGRLWRGWAVALAPGTKDDRRLDRVCIVAVDRAALPASLRESSA